jgi:hypothetical protein
MRAGDRPGGWRVELAPTVRGEVTMRGAIRKAGRVLFALIVLAMFAPYVAPPFLDRIYYRGPVSAHFDGERFYNPAMRCAGR